MPYFQAKQLRHKASGQIFNATPALELDSAYEVFCEEHVVFENDETPEVAEPPKRRGRPPKVAALEVGDADNGDS